MAESYKKVIADNANVALIHISADQSEDAAEEWAAKEQFPWLTVLPGDRTIDDFSEFKAANSVPHYVMVSRDGTQVVTGSASPAEALRKAEEFGASAE